MIFNLDAMFAVLIASMFISAIALMQPSQPANINLERIANDMSTTLDKSSALSTLNITLISGNLSMLLPANIDSAVDISCYTHNGSAFVFNQSVAVLSVKNSTETQPTITSVRYFPMLGATSVSKYCIARLEVWYI